MRTLSSFVIVCLLGPLAFGRTLSVCEDCSYTCITEAVAVAEAGDEVLVQAGHYREGNILIDKAIHLRGENNPILDGEGRTEVLTIIADGVAVEGLVVQNVGASYLEDRAGIRVRKARGFTIRNNQLRNTFFGIYLEHSREGTITGNQVTGQAVEEMSSGNAIHLWYCENVLVEGNRASGHRDGIYLEFVDSSLVRNNLSEDNLRYGLHFMFSNDNDYSGNTFRRNGAGVAVMFSRNINMWENHFEYNWGRAAYGLLLKEIYDAEISRNVFRENTIGIYVEGSTRLQYTDNEFRRNGWAIRMSGGCLDNEINRNNFIGNTFDLALASAPNNNDFNGNYWSEYSGYDLGRDGVGDVPYHPVKLFNYIINKTPESIVLLRSFFVGLLNFSEKVSPVFTPANVQDQAPLMKALPLINEKPEQ